MEDDARALFREPVAGRDGVWLQDAPSNLMVINSVFTVDRLEREVLRDVWNERVIQAGGGARYPRFARKVVFRGRRAFWEDDPDFDVDRHVVLAPPLAEDPLALSSREKLQRYVGEEASRPLPADRPLWQLQVVPEYRDGMSAVIVRIHHVMGDGVSLVPILFSLMDTEEGGDRTLPAVAKKTTAWHVTAAVLAGPFLLAQKFSWRGDRSVVHGPPLSGRKRVAWTDPIDVDLVKRVKNALGATVNDVLMACVSGAFERYVARRGGVPMRKLRVSMPVNVRPFEEEPRMENRFAAVMLDLPVGAGDVRARVAATKRRLDRLKRSPEPLFTYGVVRLMLAALPSGLSRFLIDFLANKCTCVVSNVPGPRSALYLAGRRVRGFMFWVPQRSGIGIGISMLSFAGELMVGAMCDTEVVDDPRLLMECFSEELRGLREAAGLGEE